MSDDNTKQINSTVEEILKSQDEYTEATGYPYDFSSEEIDGEREDEERTF